MACPHAASVCILSLWLGLSTFPNENHYAINFGGEYGFKGGNESMILTATPAESMILSAWWLLPLSPLPLSPSTLPTSLLSSLQLLLPLPTSVPLPPPLLTLPLPPVPHFLLQLFTESMILSAPAESIILSVGSTEGMILISVPTLRV
jgi:hypothetical protein